MVGGFWSPQDLSLKFMVAGHTKFASDRCFGFLKRAFRREHMSGLCEFKAVADGSAECNGGKLVGHEEGTSFVDVGNWQDHHEPYFSFYGIKRLQHFR